MAGFCPQCGTSLDDDARFCPKCGRPVEATTSTPASFTEKYAGTPYSATPSQPAPATMSPGVSHRSLVTGVIAILLVVAVIGAWQLGLFAGLTSTAGTAGDIPPSGQIWFGSSFDTNTFALSGITTTFKPGETAALVAQLPRSVSEGDMNMRVSLDGTVIVNQAIAMQGSGDVFGITLTPFVVAGTYKYDLVDIGGNALASGSLTVTE